MEKLIIFVCVSNTCRSPICENLMRQKLEANGMGAMFRVASRSLTTDYEPEFSQANEQGRKVLKNEFNIDMDGHRSKLLSANDVETASIIIPVKRNLGLDIAHVGGGNAKSKLMYFDNDISDPWRQPYEVYAHCAHNISSQLDALITRISSAA